MFCAISGQEPEEPVVSTKSGHVFEKRLIKKYLETNGNICPITKETLTSSDLVDLQVSVAVKPRPASATSIPGMLQLFQSEWDAVMLESFSLKQQLDAVRQQLSHTLYQQDAACRVIARLIKERDEARKALTQLSSSVTLTRESADASAATSLSLPPVGLPDDVKEKLINQNAKLTGYRRKRIISKDLSPKSDIKNYIPVSSQPTHSSSKAGITCLALAPPILLSSPDDNNDNNYYNLVATGGMDSSISIFDKDSNSIIQRLKGHRKRIKQIEFFRSYDSELNLSSNILRLLSLSNDNTVLLWNSNYDKSNDKLHFTETPQMRYENLYADNNSNSNNNSNNNNNDVVGIAVQPCGDYFVSAANSGAWALTELSSGSNVWKYNSNANYSCIKFHPDGLVLGIGNNNGDINVWDLSTMENVADFVGHSAKVTGLCFSENGYYSISCAVDQTIKLWDLRKLKVLQTIDLANANNNNSNNNNNYPNAVNFDESGNYVAVAGPGKSVSVFTFKTKVKLEKVCEWEKDCDDVVTDVKFGPLAKYLATTSMDRNLRFYSLPSDDSMK